MEYEVDAAQTLLLKRIFMLFRHVSASVQIVASPDGLQLHALNSANSAWMNIKLGKQFFRRIDWPEPEGSQETEDVPCRYLIIGAKNLCQALSIVIPSGAKNQGYSAVFLKDVVQGDDNTVKTMVALEKLIIRDVPIHGNVISFVLSCAGEHIQRSAVITFDEYKTDMPLDIMWENWHYLRIQPTVLYKSINPYWSPFDDVAISYNAKRSDLSLNIVKSIIKNTGRNKSKASRRAGITGKITINSSHLLRLKFDDNLPYPKDITISLKELLSLTAFCESVKTPLSFLMRNPGDPVIVIFGDAVDIAETATGVLSVHQIIEEATTPYDMNTLENILMKNQTKSWSGSLWMSSTQKCSDENVNQTDDTVEEANSEDVVTARTDESIDYSETSVSEEATVNKSEVTSVNTADIFKDPLAETSQEEEISSIKDSLQFSHIPRQTRDEIYKILALDFRPAALNASNKSGNNLPGYTPLSLNDNSRSGEASLASEYRDRDRQESVYEQLAGIW